MFNILSFNDIKYCTNSLAHTHIYLNIIQLGNIGLASLLDHLLDDRDRPVGLLDAPCNRFQSFEKPIHALLRDELFEGILGRGAVAREEIIARPFRVGLAVELGERVGGALAARTFGTQDNLELFDGLGTFKNILVLRMSVRAENVAVREGEGGARVRGKGKVWAIVHNTHCCHYWRKLGHPSDL